MNRVLFYLFFQILVVISQAQSACSPIVGIAAPPPFAIRSMAEWEELDAILISWRVNSQYPGADRVLADIIKSAQPECKVIIACETPDLIFDANTILQNYGVVTSSNIVYIVGKNNSIWTRDYAPNTVYRTDNHERIFVDWIYNNPIRVKDDTLSTTLATFLETPLYSMTDTFGLVNVGGNFMTDGLDRAFSTKLVLEDNALNDNFCIDLTESQIDDFHQKFMGINKYIKLNRMPFDTLDHLDMHWKMLDETTFLVSKYPDNGSNGPYLETNVSNFVNTYKTPFNTKYRMVRVPMSPDLEGDFPQSEADTFRTYSNAVFINKTILVPTYNAPTDSLALAIWRNEKPGYKVVGINSGPLIRRNGALHCVVKEIGAANPLTIQHGSKECAILTTEGIYFEVNTQHKSGIASVLLYWKKENDPDWQSIELSQIVGTNIWNTHIPNQTLDTKIQYYFQATANDGKVQKRPMPAPDAYFNTKICDNTINIAEISTFKAKIIPNTTNDYSILSFENNQNKAASLTVFNALGERVRSVFMDNFNTNLQEIRIEKGELRDGVYWVVLNNGNKSEALIWVLIN
jgi:agmatine deiminase